MAVGKPVICVDLGGPGFRVTGETGVKVPPGSREEVVGGIAQALTALASDAVRRAAAGEAGVRRVTSMFTWEQRAAFFDGLYRECVEGEASR